MFKEYTPKDGWIKENARRKHQSARAKTANAIFSAVTVVLFYGFLQAVANV